MEDSSSESLFVVRDGGSDPVPFRCIDSSGHVNGECTITLRDPYNYGAFEKSFHLKGKVAAYVSQHDLYSKHVAFRVERALRGLNSLHISFGECCAGKTYSIFGSPSVCDPSGRGLSQASGLFQRSLVSIFGGLEAQKRSVRVQVACIEILSHVGTGGQKRDLCQWLTSKNNIENRSSASRNQNQNEGPCDVSGRPGTAASEMATRPSTRQDNGSRPGTQMSIFERGECYRDVASHGIGAECGFTDHDFDLPKHSGILASDEFEGQFLDVHGWNDPLVRALVGYCSSRRVMSHVIITTRILTDSTVRRNYSVNVADQVPLGVCGSISFVDLASATCSCMDDPSRPSPREYSPAVRQADARRVRVRESIMALTRVLFRSQSTQGKKTPFALPFRENLLTRVLQPLVVNSSVACIYHLSSDIESYMNNVRTLYLAGQIDASRCVPIVNIATLVAPSNVIPCATCGHQIEYLRNQLTTLELEKKELLNRLSVKVNGYLPPVTPSRSGGTQTEPTFSCEAVCNTSGDISSLEKKASLELTKRLKLETKLENMKNEHERFGAEKAAVEANHRQEIKNLRTKVTELENGIPAACAKVAEKYALQVASLSKELHESKAALTRAISGVLDKNGAFKSQALLDKTFELLKVKVEAMTNAREASQNLFSERARQDQFSAADIANEMRSQYSSVLQTSRASVESLKKDAVRERENAKIKTESDRVLLLNAESHIQSLIASIERHSISAPDIVRNARLFVSSIRKSRT